MDIIITVLMIVGVILISMTLHEAMHAFVSYWLGDDTAKLQGRLTLNPIKHIDPFLTLLLPLGLAVAGLPIFGGAKPVPFNPDRVKGGDWGAALVALGGPLTNLVLAFIFYGIWVMLDPVTAASWVGTLIGLFWSVNLGFFVFNMLPIPPLDGSRVIYAIAPEFVRAGMRFIERYGVFVIFIIVLLAAQPLGILLGAINESIISAFNLVFRS